MLLERLEEKFRNRQSSYMMVVILAMLDLAWPSGKAMLNDVVNYFKGFYERRLQVGKKPEKEGLRLFSVSTLTDIEIRRTVIENPVRYLQDFLFMMETGKSCGFRMICCRSLPMKTPDLL